MACLQWIAFLAIVLLPAVAQSDPSWAGGGDTTAQRFDFTTADESVIPDTAANSFGIAVAEIEAVVPPGSGWQNPNDEFVTAGINGGDGAWDLGPDGLIGVTVPLSPTPPPGLSYDVEIHIEAIVYQGPVQRPTLSVAGHTIDGFAEVAQLVEQDPPFGGYYLVTWTGVVSDVDAAELEFVVAAGEFGALVDSIEIHTRYALNKAPATVTLSNLEHLFDGNPKSATVTTDPPGLAVVVTYDGGSTPPTNTGSYEVVATVNDPVYAGAATGVLQIANETQSIDFPPITDKVATDSVSLSATGGGSGNAVEFEVAAGPGTIGPGNVLTFTGAGSVTITATQAGNMNYLPAAPVDRTFTVTKASATVVLNGLAQTYDGGPKSAGATTTPGGLSVVFTYDGDPGLPVAAGSYAVEATINEALYEGSANGSLVVSPATQTITFPPVGNQLANATVNLLATGGGSGNPVTYVVDFGPAQIGPGNVLSFTGAGPVSVTASQAGGANHLDAPEVTRSFTVSKASATVSLNGLSTTYDGAPKPVGATTAPTGLTVAFTYGGDPSPPTGAGDYAVVGTIVDEIYEGSANGTLSVAKAAQTLEFPVIPNQPANATVTLTATGGGSTSPVAFAVNSGPATLGAGNALTFSGTGEVSVTASQAGDDNYFAAMAITRTFMVAKAAATVVLDGLDATFDGSTKLATATTDPPGLTVNLTYDGGPTPPTGAGSYAVVATIDEALYEGTATGDLVIAKAAQSIDFPPIANQLTTATVNLAATGGDSGNSVTFAVTAGPGSIAGGDVLTFTGAGEVSITASQEGNDNYLDAPAVIRTFTVAKTAATVTVNGLSQTYDGSPKAVSTTTVPPGLTVVVTYEGDVAAPVDAGSYAVVATIDDPIYEGSSVKALTVAKASQTIDFPSIANQLATATVNLAASGGGSGNPVTFAVSTGPAEIGPGEALTFTGAGAVSITASQAGDGNHFPAAEVTRAFTVAKATATVALVDLAQTYDGTPKGAGATTTPAGLTVAFTYNGDPALPTEAGSYGVVATIDDAIYQGSASGSFTIAKAPQAIDFPPIADQLTTATVNLAATGGASGNGVTFEVTSGPATLGVGNVLSFTGSGSVSVTATQAGNDNYLAATPIVRTFSVAKSPATVNLAGLSHTYDGTPKAAVATTVPAGLTVALTYNANSLAPSGAGDYAVVATIEDAIYEGSASAVLSIAKATQAINFASIPDQLANATVNLAATGGESGTAVTFAVTAGPAVIGSGNVLGFTGAGSVTVTASQADGPNHLAAPDVSRTFNVSKAPATVELGGLLQTYDGAGKEATATTIPTGLGVEITYDGNSALPVGAGSYLVVGTIIDAIYEGSVNGTLEVAKAAQAIDFPAIPDQLASAVLNLVATGGGSANPVTFAVASGPAVLGAGDVLSFTGAGSVTVTASQGGGDNHFAAVDVSRTFEVDYSGYDAWRDLEYPGESDPAIIGFSARPNGNALPNGFRYFLGNGALDPMVLVAHGEVGGEWSFSHFRFEPARDDVGIVYEWSTDLDNWLPDGGSFEGTTVDLETSEGAPGVDGRVPVQVLAVPGGLATDRLFVRIRLLFPLPIP